MHPTEAPIASTPAMNTVADKFQQQLGSCESVDAVLEVLEQCKPGKAVSAIVMITRRRLVDITCDSENNTTVSEIPLAKILDELQPADPRLSKAAKKRVEAAHSLHKELQKLPM